jgi:quercetin 2,3-dioxygenase
MADSAILQTVPLGFQWPTIDPFLFCVHHDDAYPRGNGQFGPAASLAGRNMGADFEGRDGWRMYHGSTVPGFPQHPHRGFETVTYARRGLIDHSDSMGAAARFGRGDVQWMTAGRGVVHSEMFPLLDEVEPNPLELFQIWVNLPAVDKMVEPHFAMLWDEHIPRIADVAGSHNATVTVIAGALGDALPPSPPPNSWASRADGDLAIWHVRLESDGRFALPPARHPDAVRVVYVFAAADQSAGDDVVMSFNGEGVPVNTGVVVRSDLPVELASLHGAEALVLQARPIGEPVAQHGPFVMNTHAEIEQAFADYRRTQFGGWPWPADDPVHGGGSARFARHADGRIERPATIGAAAAVVDSH